MIGHRWFSVVLVVLGGCSDSARSTAVTAPGSAVLVQPDGTAFCSAVLVEPRWALTAAHCADALTDAAFARARVRVTATDGMSIETGVRARHVHPRYRRGRLHDDLAVLALDKPIEDVAIASLSSASCPEPLLARGDLASIVGLGAASASPRRVEVAAHTRSQIATTPSPDTTCHGDSGGGLFATTPCGPILIGVVSAGSGDCRGRSVHTRVAGYRAFIDEVLASR